MLILHYSDDQFSATVMRGSDGQASRVEATSLRRHLIKRRSKHRHQVKRRVDRVLPALKMAHGQHTILWRDAFRRRILRDKEKAVERDVTDEVDESGMKAVTDDHGVQVNKKPGLSKAFVN